MAASDVGGCIDIRVTRSGKRYSPFFKDVPIVIRPARAFDLEGRLEEQRLLRAALEAAGEQDPEEELPLEASPKLLPLVTQTLRPSKATASKGMSPSRQSRKRDRQEVRALRSPSGFKGIARSRVAAALENGMKTVFPSAEARVASSGWVGIRQTANTGKPKALQDILRMDGFKLVEWDGIITIPIVDGENRIIALLGGRPAGATDWHEVHGGAFQAMYDAALRCTFPSANTEHRRGSYPALSTGISFGGGQQAPGNLSNTDGNTVQLARLLDDPNIARVAGFANCLFQGYHPNAHRQYTSTLATLISKGEALRRNFRKSSWAACTFNFGPNAVTVPHLDCANLAWGWCSITALGNFDPKKGGHLVLWDLGLVIQFPPGATILIPSALLEHSNIPVEAGSVRASFTQYTAGGLFRWVDNGCRTDKVLLCTATAGEIKAWQEAKTTRWDEALTLFTVVKENKIVVLSE